MPNKSKPAKTPYKALVKSKEDLASGFIRLTCAHNHPEISEAHKGGYIKLLAPSEGDKTKKRSITISDAEPGAFTLDFVDHGQSGPAANWARKAKAGDEFDFLGPGPAADTDLSSDHFRFLGDRTAFPAIHHQLSRLCSNDFISCEIALLVTNENEGLYFDGYKKIKKFTFKLLYEIDPAEYMTSLPNEGLSLWAAGERKSIKSLKKELKEQKREFVHKYISSYWQPGKDQEEHSFLKKLDSSKYD